MFYLKMLDSSVFSLQPHIFKFAFMDKFLQLYRFVPTTTTTLDQPTLLDVLNPQPC